MSNFKGTIDDPELTRECIYRRWFVLKTLLGLEVLETGSRRSMTGESLAELYLLEGRNGEFPATRERHAKLLAQAGRHFGQINSAERCCYWINAATDVLCAFGVTREPATCRGREIVDPEYGESISSERFAGELLAKHEFRLAAFALSGEPPDDERGATRVRKGPELAGALLEGPSIREKNLADAPTPAPLARRGKMGLQQQNAEDDRPVEEFEAQFAEKDLVSGKPLGAYDLLAVEVFVDRVEELTSRCPRSTIFEILAGFVSIGPEDLFASSPRTAYLVEREFASRLSPWEKNAVLLRLCDLAVRLLRERAIDWADHAEPARKRVSDE